MGFKMTVLELTFESDSNREKVSFLYSDLSTKDPPTKIITTIFLKKSFENDLEVIYRVSIIIEKDLITRTNYTVIPTEI